jgi:hypothetical protein
MAFFVWIAALGRIPTLYNLRKRHIIVIDWCYMPRNNVEPIDHLLLHCGIARELWVSVLCFRGRVELLASLVVIVT